MYLINLITTIGSADLTANARGVTRSRFRHQNYEIEADYICLKKWFGIDSVFENY